MKDKNEIRNDAQLFEAIEEAGHEYNPGDAIQIYSLNENGSKAQAHMYLIAEDPATIWTAYFGTRIFNI